MSFLEDLLEPGGLPRVYAGVLDFLGLDVGPAANLTSAEAAPSNRRSVAPYNVSTDAYRAMVAAAHIEAFSHAADELESDWGSIS